MGFLLLLLLLFLDDYVSAGKLLRWEKFSFFMQILSNGLFTENIHKTADDSRSSPSSVVFVQTPVFVLCVSHHINIH